MKCFLDFTEKRIDCAKAEEWLKTTPNSECALNALAIGNPVEDARLYLDGTMQICIDAEDSLELWQIILNYETHALRVSQVSAAVAKVSCKHGLWHSQEPISHLQYIRKCGLIHGLLWG